MTTEPTVPDPIRDALEAALDARPNGVIANSDLVTYLLDARLIVFCDDVELEPTIGQLLAIGYSLASGQPDAAFDAFIDLAKQAVDG